MFEFPNFYASTGDTNPKLESYPERTLWRTCTLVEVNASHEASGGPGRYILLLHRNQGKDWWECPGGEYSFSNFYYGRTSVKQEAERELREETGLDIEITEMLSRAARGAFFERDGEKPISNGLFYRRLSLEKLPEIRLNTLTHPEHDDYMWLKVGGLQWNGYRQPEFNFDRKGKLSIFTDPDYRNFAFMPNLFFRGNTHLATRDIKFSEVTQAMLKVYEARIRDFIRYWSFPSSSFLPEEYF